MSERVYIVADGLPICSGRDYDELVRLRDRHWPGALILDHAPDPGKVKIVTEQVAGQRLPAREWRAWREPRPGIRGYGKTEQEAIDDLVENVQPL